jgi:hypothetical protein
LKLPDFAIVILASSAVQEIPSRRQHTGWNFPAMVLKKCEAFEKILEPYAKSWLPAAETRQCRFKISGDDSF